MSGSLTRYPHPCSPRYDPGVLGTLCTSHRMAGNRVGDRRPVRCSLRKVEVSNLGVFTPPGFRIRFATTGATFLGRPPHGMVTGDESTPTKGGVWGHRLAGGYPTSNLLPGSSRLGLRTGTRLPLCDLEAGPAVNSRRPSHMVAPPGFEPGTYGV